MKSEGTAARHVRQFFVFMREAGPPAFRSEEIDGVYVFERVMLYQNSEKWN